VNAANQAMTKHPEEQIARKAQSDQAAVAVSQAMQQATTAYAGGEWEEAERWCRTVLAVRADCFDALNLLGVIAAQTRRAAEAAELLGRAVSADPGNASAHYNYGNVLLDLKRFADALHSYERALQITPGSAALYNNRGVTLQKLKRCEDALDSYARALQIKPDYADAYFNLGNTLQELSRFEDALESYARALKCDPGLAEAYNNRGNALQELKRFADALDSYAQALRIKPDYADANFNRGNALQKLARFEDALESYARALQIKPDYADAYFNLGNTLQELKRFADAVVSYERALRIAPGHVDAFCNRGLTLLKLNRFEDALESYECALRIAPDCDWLYGTWLYAKRQLCDWSDSGAQITHFIAAVQQSKKVTPPFPVLALTDSLSVQRQAAQTWVNAKYPLSLSLPPIGKRRRCNRIRLGYYSADYHNHATAYLMAELFEQHDRHRFEVVGFSYGLDTRDDMRRRLAAAFDQFVDVSKKSDDEVARLSRQLEIDIAVDLKGFTLDARSGIFSRRSAPIQVNYLGYPGTMGAPYIDYLIADQTLIPPGSRQQYSERIVYLPDSYQVNDRKRQIADKTFRRAELGLPSTGFVFCCFNNNYKITPDTFAGWMRVLQRVEGSVLWLLEDNKTAADNLRREAHARDVNPERLVFAQRLPLSEHLARQRAADLFVDTLPCNAHTTASDALWVGLPVLTCLGESLAARVAASLLHASGLPELVTATQEQYEATAVELASDPGRLAQLKDRLHRNRLTMPLFDSKQFATHLESAYTQMYERYQADLSPEHICVAR
jgi:predicted O-linked N-acetylglucosamine transferase (SPINDLY family)